MKRIIMDARNPSSKDNTFRLLWAQYQQTSHHINDRNILCVPMKVLEANMKRISVLNREIRLESDVNKREAAAKECLELVEASKATMAELLKL